MQKEDAQRHVDRMQAFREELEQLEAEEILSLSAENWDRIDNYHRARRAELARQCRIQGGNIQIDRGLL